MQHPIAIALVLERARDRRPLDVLVLCSPATDLEKHHEVIKINQALSKELAMVGRFLRRADGHDPEF